MILGRSHDLPWRPQKLIQELKPSEASLIRYVLVKILIFIYLNLKNIYFLELFPELIFIKYGRKLYRNVRMWAIRTGGFGLKSPASSSDTNPVSIRLSGKKKTSYVVGIFAVLRLWAKKSRRWRKCRKKSIPVGNVNRDQARYGYGHNPDRRELALFRRHIRYIGTASTSGCDVRVARCWCYDVGAVQ